MPLRDVIKRAVLWLLKRFERKMPSLLDSQTVEE